MSGDGCCPAGCDFTTDSDCPCQPATCAAQGLSCGTIPDGCGGTVDCGTCSAVQTCGGGGTANVCGGRVEKSLPICSADGWCWDNPSPQGNDVQAAVSLPSGDNWVAGRGGTVLHFDGAQWSGATAIAPADFYAVYASSNGDVWAGGMNGTLVHWNGSAWSNAASPTTSDVRGLWGTGASQVWAVGLSGTVLAWNGSAWSKVTVPTTADLYGVFGTSASDVWAVGNQVILHYDGAKWTSTATTAFLASVWAASPTNAWAVSETAMLQWDGSSWTAVPNVVGSAVFGNSATDVWVAYDDHTSFHFDGQGWTPFAISTANSEVEVLEAITGAGGVMLAAGTDGMLYRYAGGTWYRVSTGVAARTPDVLNLRQGVVASPTDVFVSGSKNDPAGFGSFAYVLGRTAAGVAPSFVDTGASVYYGIAASSPSDAWTAAGSAVEHFIGGAWTSAGVPATPSIMSLAAVSPADVGSPATPRPRTGTAPAGRGCPTPSR